MFPWQLVELQSRLTKKSGFARWIEGDWARATDRVATDSQATVKEARQPKISARVTRVQIRVIGNLPLRVPLLR